MKFFFFNKEFIDYSMLKGLLIIGLRRKAWARLDKLEKSFLKACLVFTKSNGRIKSLKIILQIAKITLKLLSSMNAMIIKAGKAKAQALLKLYGLNNVFKFCPSLKEWLKEPSYIIYLGLKEVFG
ncbi:MAG: hypothetical protein QW589_03730 [Candidatus Bathyarchaeia archaeon]